MNDLQHYSCREYLEMSRRQFLAASGATAVAFSSPAWLPRVALAQDACTDRDVIVSIFLAGAADCLTLCVPHGEDAYYDARPTQAIPRPDSGSPIDALDLDGFFGFPQTMAQLLPVFAAGHLLVVHATGLDAVSRSHFDAIRMTEIGAPAIPSMFSGWLGRHLASVAPILPNSALRALNIGSTLRRILNDAPQTVSTADLTTFGLSGSVQTMSQRRVALDAMYAAAIAEQKVAAETTQLTIDLLSTIDFQNYAPAGGAVYDDNSTFGKAIKSTAALVMADVGVEAVAIEIGGWDTHIEMGAPQGVLADKLVDLAAGLSAFYADVMAGNGRNVTVVVQSEFGRRLLENGDEGTDHGHGGAMLVMGRQINGGQVLTLWPGLQPENLFEGRDLQVTIDYRDIVAEILQERMANANLAGVFPNYTPTFRNVTSTCPLSGGNPTGAWRTGQNRHVQRQ